MTTARGGVQRSLEREAETGRVRGTVLRTVCLSARRSRAVCRSSLRSPCPPRAARRPSHGTSPASRHGRCAPSAALTRGPWSPCNWLPTGQAPRTGASPCAPTGTRAADGCGVGSCRSNRELVRNRAATVLVRAGHGLVVNLPGFGQVVTVPAAGGPPTSNTGVSSETVSNRTWRLLPC